MASLLGLKLGGLMNASPQVGAGPQRSRTVGNYPVMSHHGLRGFQVLLVVCSKHRETVSHKGYLAWKNFCTGAVNVKQFSAD